MRILDLSDKIDLIEIKAKFLLQACIIRAFHCINTGSKAGGEHNTVFWKR